MGEKKRTQYRMNLLSLYVAHQLHTLFGWDDGLLLFTLTQCPPARATPDTSWYLYAIGGR